MRATRLLALAAALGPPLLVTGTASAQTEKVIFTFTGGPSGVDPVGRLVSDQSGNIYGTASLGGTSIGGSSCGIAFELTRQKTWSAIWNFQGTNVFDGCQPIAAMIFDAAGNLYGTTYAGGIYGYGTAFELSPAAGGVWTEKVLWNFGRVQDREQGGSNPSAGLTFDSAGNLYGTTEAGGARGGCGTVFELSPDPDGTWSETLLHTFVRGGTDGSRPAASVTLDSAGNIYGTTAQGGNQAACAGGCGTVFELEKARGWKQIQLYVFGHGSDGGFPGGPVVFDHAGNLLGTAIVVFKLAKTKAGWKETVLDPLAYAYEGVTIQGDHLYFVGGIQGFGEVIELVPSSTGWTENVLHVFGGEHGNGDGAGPTGGLIIGPQGQLFGATQSGGVDDYGTVYEVTP